MSEREIGPSRGAERRRERQREELRGEILDAARELVNQRGVAALTMRAVAEAVGYSPGALYEYFRSKNEILETLYFHGSEGLNARTEQVLAAAGPDVAMLGRMRLAARAYRAYALEHPDLYRLIYSVTNPQPAELPDVENSSFGALVGLLREAVARGELRMDDPLTTAAGLWAYVHGFVMLEITGRLPNHPPGISDTLFEAGLGTIAFGLLPRDDTRTEGSST